MEPLERAVACLGPAKLVVKGSGSQTDINLPWLLNGKDGMTLANGLFLQATMYYKIVKQGQTWRVSTLSYQYDLMRENDPM